MVTIALHKIQKFVLRILAVNKGEPSWSCFLSLASLHRFFPYILHEGKKHWRIYWRGPAFD